MKLQAQADATLVDVCRQAISIDSSPSAGTAAIAGFLAEYAQKFGFQTELIHETHHGVDEASLILTLGSNGKSTEKSAEKYDLVLQAHLDTPDPGSYSRWAISDENPFKATIYQERLYGLGASEGKLDFICKMWAAKNYVKKTGKTVAVIGTYGANTGMTGAMKLFRQRKLKAEQMLIGAPTGLHVAQSAPGIAVIHIQAPFTDKEIQHRLDHDTKPSVSTQSKVFKKKQQNPISELLQFVGQLPDGIAVMEIDGGTDPFTSPDTAWIEFDMDGSFDQTIVQKLIHIKSTLDRLESELRDGKTANSPVNLGSIRTHENHISLSLSCHLGVGIADEVYREKILAIDEACKKVGATFQLAEYKSAFSTPANDAFIQQLQKTAKESSLESSLQGYDACTEASVFGRLARCAVFGPGRPFSHETRHDEHVPVQDLNRAVEFYDRLLGGLFK